MIIYPTIEENLKLRTFKIFVSGKYEPNLPKFFIDANTPPFYQDVDNWAHSFVPPVIIVDMCFQEVDFSIPNIEDMETVIRLLETYTDKASMIEFKPRELQTFLEKCELSLFKLREAHHDYIKYLRNKYPDKYGKSENILTYLDSFELVKP